MNREYYRNEFIRELREAKGLTQAELADRVKITSVSVSRVETGVSCSFVTLCKIAGALDVKWYSLLRIDSNQTISQIV